MKTKKRGYFVWMLVFVMLVFGGCGKKPEVENVQNEEQKVVQKEGQKDFVEKALKEIVKKMKPDGPKSKENKVQRSLANHILKDHTAMMAHFQSKEFTKMEEVWKDIIGTEKVKVYMNDPNEKQVEWKDPNTKFWEDLYNAKVVASPDAASYELEIYADDITLSDLTPIVDGKNCSATEVFKFRVIALDENGNVISNAAGGGRIDRLHSGACPWGL